jgi:lysophospholipase L1-like esterase
MSRVSWLAVVLVASGGAAWSQPAMLGPAQSACARLEPEPAAVARREALAELVLVPTPPEEYWRALAQAQATAPAGDAGRIAEQLALDWPNLCRYQQANAALRGAAKPTAVFMGDSITEGWVGADPDLFAGGNVGRGIGGQTSPQMLVRFRQDVVALEPRVVHLMAGTNDIAGNTGPMTVESYRHNIAAMIDLARANGIAVVLAAVPPSRRLYWRELDPRPWIRELNEWLSATAAQQGLEFVDYGTVLADAEGGLRADLGNDGVHPNRAGYAAMRPLAQRAIAAALERGGTRTR